MAIQPRRWWKRWARYPAGVTFTFYLFWLFGFVSLAQRSFPYWYFAGLVSFAAGFAFLLRWRHQHPEDARRRRIEAGYPPEPWWDRRWSGV
jgi:hypothetical protein